MLNKTNTTTATSCEAITDDSILDCGHKPSPHESFTTGYGTTPDNKKLCNACCGELDKADMISSGKATLYLTSGDGPASVSVGNWPGTLKLPCHHIRKGNHNIAGSRYDVWFTGPDGKNWHGVQYGDNTQICHCRRIKS